MEADSEAFGIIMVLDSTHLGPVAYVIQYDFTIPLGVIGGCQVTITDVEEVLYTATFTGALGAIQ